MELFQFIYEVLIFWNPFLNKPNDAVFVDKVSNPSPTVEFLDRFIFYKISLFNSASMSALAGHSAVPRVLVCLAKALNSYCFLSRTLKIKWTESPTQLQKIFGRVQVEQNVTVCHRHFHRQVGPAV